MSLIDSGISALFNALPAALLLEDGRPFALHRGRRLPLPTDPAALLPYLQSAAALDPAPSPLWRYIEGRMPVPPESDG